MTVYLDNNATTRVDPRVVEAMLPFFTETYGNPSSKHAPGAAAAVAMQTARRQLQDLIGADRDSEIIFNSGGTESVNAAILSALENAPMRREMIISAVEHSAVRSLAEWLAKNKGIRVHTIPVDANGRIDVMAYKEALSERVALVSIMWANNETGNVMPVAELAEMAKEVGATFHTDAVQAVGKLPIDLKSTVIDMLSLSGHKLHAPKGIGALYVRKGVRFKPQIKGGHQERNRRAGTENVPGIVALGKAAELAAAHMAEEETRVKALRDRLEQGLKQAIPNAHLIGADNDRLPNTSNIAFDYIESESILLLLDKEGIAASAGSACSSGSFEPSHVLKAMSVPETAIRGGIRFSLSRDNTDEDVDRVLAVMPGIVEKLREISPFGEGTEAPESAYA
jgi:cysteine desulfurase